MNKPPKCTYVFGLVPQVPDLLFLLIWVLCGIDADQFPNRDAFLDLHDLGRWNKHWGLIDIFHVDHHGSSGSWELHCKGSLVGHFYVQGVLVLSLKIQTLGEKKNLGQHFVRRPVGIRRIIVKGPRLLPPKKSCFLREHLLGSLRPLQRLSEA